MNKEIDMLTIGSLVVESLDYIFIVDKNYRIIYNTRYDDRLNNESAEYSAYDIHNKKFFDVYPALRKEDSSIARCIETGEIVINKCQVIYDFMGRRYVTNNVTFPLIRKGELMAVVELSMDVDENDKEGDFAGVNRKFDEFVLKLKKDAGYITFDKILTRNEQMKFSIEKAKLLATLPNPTLIYGETGTGKELFAQSMINYSQVPKNKVVIQNCAAVPENLMESILFGTVKGVYTGAENMKGLFEQADGGVLFLDELNSIPYGVQSKLLRVLQDGTFRPLGSNKDKHVNVKVIAAMNIDPVEAMEKNIIRSDLFYRISTIVLELPPLRERREDIPLFIDFFLNKFGREMKKENITVPENVRALLENYSYPGNIRELKNLIERLLVLSEQGEIREEYLPPEVLTGSREPASEGIHTDYTESLREYRQKAEKKYIEELIARYPQDMNAVADILSITRRQLLNKLTEYKLK